MTSHILEYCPYCAKFCTVDCPSRYLFFFYQYLFFFRFLWTIFARKISTQRKWPHIYTWILSNPNKIWHNCPLACCIEIVYYFFGFNLLFSIFVGLYNLFRAPKFFQFVHSCFLGKRGFVNHYVWKYRFVRWILLFLVLKVLLYRSHLKIKYVT